MRMRFPRASAPLISPTSSAAEPGDWMLSGLTSVRERTALFHRGEGCDAPQPTDANGDARSPNEAAASTKLRRLTFMAESYTRSVIGQKGSRRPLVDTEAP